MDKIGLVTEEGADLPEEIIKRHKIAVVPIKMHWPDVENLKGKNTFQKMREAEMLGVKSFGKTSQPSVREFLTAFERQLAGFEKVIGIILTSKLSGTFNSALQARNFLKPEDQKRVFLIDSLNVTAGEAVLILRAIELIRNGKKAEEIVGDLEEFIPCVRLLGIIADPKWLEASGRISPILAGWMKKASKIGVRPLIKIKKGVVCSGGIMTGASDIPSALFKKFEHEIKKSKMDDKKIRAVITHGDDPAGAARLKELMGSNTGNVEVAFSNIIDNVLGVLTGPDSMVLSWCEI
jgi:DegV family protein with EDD domain